jgi:hypothetical protein
MRLGGWLTVLVKYTRRGSAWATKASISPRAMRAFTPQDQAPTRLQASSRAMCSGQFSATASTRSPGKHALLAQLGHQGVDLAPSRA